MTASASVSPFSRLAASAVRRGTALLGMASAALHLWAVGEHGMSSAMTLLMVSMAMMCLYCSAHLWRAASLRDWASVAVMNMAMIGVHLFVIGGGGGHHGHSASTTTTHSMSSVAALAAVLAVVEALIATMVVFSRTRSPLPVADRVLRRSSDLTQATS